RAAANRNPELFIGGGCLLAQPRERPTQTAAARLEAIPKAQHPGSALVRDTHLLVEMRCHRKGFGSELYLCRPQGIGSLQRMATLHVSPATGTVADLDVESAHDCLTHDVFLKLRLGVLVDDRGPAAQGVFGQRHRDFLIHARRNRPRGSLAILVPAFGRAAWDWALVALGEWSSLGLRERS